MAVAGLPQLLLELHVHDDLLQLLEARHGAGRVRVVLVEQPLLRLCSIQFHAQARPSLEFSTFSDKTLRNVYVLRIKPSIIKY